MKNRSSIFSPFTTRFPLAAEDMRGMLMLLGFALTAIPSQATPTPTTLTLKAALDSLVPATRGMQALRLTYENSRLAYDNYRKSLLPAIGVSLSPFSFNRAIQRLQQPSDGSYTYVEDYAGVSTLAVGVSQSLGPTGGTLTVGTSLAYLREFSEGRNSFSTRPFYVSLSQPLSGGRRSFWLTRTVQTLACQVAAKNYASGLVTMQQQAAALYLEAYVDRLALRNARLMAAASDTLLRTARMKFDMRQLTASDFKQVELARAEAIYAVTTAHEALDDALRRLASLLESDEPLTLATDTLATTAFTPLTLTEVFALVVRNHPEYLQGELDLAQARLNRHNARQETGINGTLTLDYGVNQYASRFRDAYRHPETQQAVGVTLALPVFQWGINRNRRRIAENNYQLQEIAVEQRRREFRDQVAQTVAAYNSALARHALAARSYRLAQENYQMLVRHFAMARTTVSELIEARRTLFAHQEEYGQVLRTLYAAYFDVKTLTLYDFQRRRDVSECLNLHHE